VRGGARVYWPDGRTAGTLTENDLFTDMPSQSAAGHKCFFVALVGVSHPLPLCFEPAALEDGRSFR